MQLKYGIYSSYGMKKDILQDLLLFKSSKDKKYITLKEYINNMKKNQENTLLYHKPITATSLKMGL